MRGKLLSALAALLIWLFFFLPWGDVSTGAQPAQALSGLTLALGGPDSAVPTTFRLLALAGVAGDAALLGVPLLAAVVLLLALVGRQTAVSTTLQLIASLLGLLLLGLKWIQFHPPNPIFEFEVSLRLPFWGTAAAFAAAALGSWLQRRGAGPALPAVRPAPYDVAPTWVDVDSRQPAPPEPAPASRAADAPAELVVASAPPAPAVDGAVTVAATPPARLGWLVIKEGQGAGAQYRLGEETTIGRDADNDVVLHDTAVSGHHACISLQEDAFVLADLGSTNGIYLYDAPRDHWQRVTAPLPLADGMRLMCGRIVLHVMLV